MEKILVVDDDAAIRGVLTAVLANSGFEVAEAGDGEEALERIQHENFALVLLDVWLPHMSGLEVLAEVHKMHKNPPRIIVMTADDTPETLLKAVKEQAYRYVTKPFSVNAVADLVREAIVAPSGRLHVEVISARPEWVELVVPCDFEAANRIQNFMQTLEGNLPEDIRRDVGQAFRELLLNAVEWGGQLDPSRQVRISCLRGKRLILYRIADPGKGFRLEDLKHAAICHGPDQPTEHLEIREKMGMRAGGYGLLLAREMVDELLYNELGNEVVFVKYLS
jgi:CheY-like chemotaxis protein